MLGRTVAPKAPHLHPRRLSLSHQGGVKAADGIEVDLNVTLTWGRVAWVIGVHCKPRGPSQQSGEQEGQSQSGAREEDSGSHCWL